MKLSVKGVSIIFGWVYSVLIFWSILMKLTGVGSTPFDFFDQICLGWLSASFFGLIFWTIVAFISGLIDGAILAWVYNFFADDA